MKIYRFNLNWETLNSCPEDERTLALMLGKIHNELNILGNLITTLKIDTNEIDVERHGRTAQTFMFISIISGRLYEGWVFLQDNYFGNKLSKKYFSLIGEDGNEALNKIKQYFSHNSPLNIVRNKYSFHFDPEIIKKNYESSSHVDPCQIFLGDPPNCNFFQVSESVFTRAILNEIGHGNPQVGMNKLVFDSSRMLGLFNMFVGCYFSAFLSMHWKSPLIEEEVDIGNRPNVNDFTLPFLMNITT